MFSLFFDCALWVCMSQRPVESTEEESVAEWLQPTSRQSWKCNTKNEPLLWIFECKLLIKKKTIQCFRILWIQYCEKIMIYQCIDTYIPNLVDMQGTTHFSGPEVALCFYLPSLAEIFYWKKKQFITTHIIIYCMAIFLWNAKLEITCYMLSLFTFFFKCLDISNYLKDNHPNHFQTLPGTAWGWKSFIEITYFSTSALFWFWQLPI